MNAKTDGTSAAARSPIGRERVVRTGIQLADESGIESLSMRKLAGHLGIEAMSLYHYVRNKDELLGAMLDAIYREMEFPPSSADWRSDLRTAAVSARDVLLRHPWAPSLLMSPTAPSAIGPWPPSSTTPWPAGRRRSVPPTVRSGRPRW